MFGQLLSALGNNIGNYLGGGILSTISKYGGKIVGDYLDKKFFQRKKFFHKFTNIHDSFSIVKAEYGKPIPLVFGKMRVLGQIIWADKITEKRNKFNVSKYFRSSNTTVNKETTDLEYYASFAMALCEGEISEIKRVWHHDELIDISNYKFRVYPGSETQEPDPLIIAKSQEPVTAYRALAYVVFENLPLADFDDMIPNFSFEVSRKSSSNQIKSVEDIIESMVMIPGSGEYVYDTIVQSKKTINKNAIIAPSTNINCHNEENIADSIYSLNQMQHVCNNIKWVAPVVCWFGDNIDAGKCLIKPAVEFKDKNISYSEEWKVANYNRQSAHEISKLPQSNAPVYGGSVNDNSVLRYLQELKERKLNIMFYPMFFMDVEQKPWRGRVTGTPQSIRDFFNRKHGYNDFILHYASLVKNHVDAFIIGSELIGLTKVRDGNSYPAVDELVKLAEKVKKIMGQKVKISYAADWSEYHHTEGGWFNLDPLWSSNNIDFIGIDAYFPVTDSLSSIISNDDLIKGWCSGEGYDYEMNHQTGEKKPLPAEYAWKNLRYWWSNYHTNPDNQKTNWQPKSKPIWFTEYGFPSIDKAPNQPNVFFDPMCLDGGVPRYSNGTVDFSIQRRCIRAFIEYWQTQEYIEQMFLWTWDARPYPAWPHMNVWNDGYLWEKGHWVNDKFGNSNLASIVLEMSDRCDLDTKKIDVSSIDLPIEGLIFSHQISVMNAINTLRATYFFDINTYHFDGLSFIKRGKSLDLKINQKDCIKLSENNFIEETSIPESAKLSKLNLFYIEKDNYEILHKSFNKESVSYSIDMSVNLPIILSENEVDDLGNIILQNVEIENGMIKFIVHYAHQIVQPTNFVTLACQNKSYTMRIVDVILNKMGYEVTGIIDQKKIYFQKNIANITTNVQKKYAQSKLLIDLLPSGIFSDDTIAMIAEYQGVYDKILYAKLAGETIWNKVQNILATKFLSQVLEIYQPYPQNIFLIDEVSCFIVNIKDINLTENDYWQEAMIGAEIISFKKVEQVEQDIYKISYLVRGLQGTHDFINNHQANEKFTLLDQGMKKLSLSNKLINQIVDFKCGDVITSMLIKKPEDNFTIYITENRLQDQVLYLSWAHRIANQDGWIEAVEGDFEYKIIVHSGRKTVEFESKTTSLIANKFTFSGDYKINIITKSI